MNMGILLAPGGILEPIAKLFGYIMNAIFNFLNMIGIPSIGLSIILFTIIVYMLMLPMQIKQQKFSKLSAVMNPEIQAIQKKYKNKKDQASMMKMQEETKLVYQKYGTSPTGGCLGSLIQFPFLFALWPVIQYMPYFVKSVRKTYMPLVNDIMKQKGYAKIMKEIGTKAPILMKKGYDYKDAKIIASVLHKFQDGTWGTLAKKFPEIGGTIDSVKENVKQLNYFLGMNIAETPSSIAKASLDTKAYGIMILAVMIPVLAGVTQWLSVKISQATMDSAAKAQQDENNMAQQMNSMFKIMPLISVFMCFSMPVGLGLYWVTSAVVRTIQMVIINKQLDKKPIEALVKENVDKTNKKNSKKKKVESSKLNSMAQTYTKKLEEAKAEAYKNMEEKEKAKAKTSSSSTYNSGAKKGSLASKANMVSDYNKRNNK